MSERPIGAHTVTSYTTIDDVGQIQISFPGKADRTITMRSDGEICTWAPGLEAKTAEGERPWLRALQWAMTGEGRP